MGAFSACQKSPLDIFDKLLSKLQNKIKVILILQFLSPAGGLLNAKGAQGRPFHTFPAEFPCVFFLFSFGNKPYRYCPGVIP